VQEIGPYGIGWKERSHTWARHANLLFVDSPVGTGFSYVASNDSYATDNDMICLDLLSFLKFVT
jgi:serine carboxypeptidase 1